MVIFSLLFKFPIFRPPYRSAVHIKNDLGLSLACFQFMIKFVYNLLMPFLCHTWTNLTAVLLGELTVKASKWPINITLLMNVIAGIHSMIAYILVTWEASVFLYNHDSNDISPLWPLFHVWNYRISGKILIEYSGRVWKCCCRSSTPLDSAINNFHKLFWSYTT